MHVWSNLPMSVHDTQQLNAQPRLCTQREPSTLVLLRVFVNIFDVKLNQEVLLCYWASVSTSLSSLFSWVTGRIFTPHKGRKIGRKRLIINSGIDNFNNMNKIKQSILIILKHNKHSSVIWEGKMLETDRKNGWGTDFSSLNAYSRCCC